MKILINAISISEGGGLIVLKKLVTAMSQLNTSVRLYIAAEPSVISQLQQNSSVIGFPYSWVRKSPLHLIYWYEFTLPKLVNYIQADICFSQTNFLPRRKLACPTLLLVQQAGYFSKKFEELYFKWFRKFKHRYLWQQRIKWVKKSIKKSNYVTVQTAALARSIVNDLNISNDKIIVIPHGSGFLNSYKTNLNIYQKNVIWRIGYITKFGVQKNFETAFKAIKKLKDQNLAVKLVLTLDEKTAEYPYISKQIEYHDIGDMIENHGELNNINELRKLYESLNLFIFPSLCESFGFTLIEAMAMGLPVVAADTCSNREISGDANLFFSPEDSNDLADKIHDIINNENLFYSKSQDSINRAKDFCWDKAADRMLDIIYKIVNKEQVIV